MTTISLELSQLLTALDLGDHVTESMHGTLVEMAEKLEEACRGSVDVLTRPHEWAIYRPDHLSGDAWMVITPHGIDWLVNLRHPCVLRFDTFAEAQAYIDKHNIQDAYPWAVPVIAK